MDLGLNSKRALVFGAGSGLGKAVALALAEEGATVVAAGRSLEKLNQTVAEIKDFGGTAFALEWDLLNLSEIPGKMSQATSALQGNVEILFNNGGGPPPSSVQGQPPHAWENQFNNLVMPVIAITDAVLPAMKEAHWGRIITNASSGVVVPIPNLAMSNTLRSALVGWNKSLAKEVASNGITVNMVLPGRIATERTRFLDATKATKQNVPVEEIERLSRASIPVGRYGKTSEYGDVVAFLGSEKSSYVTGSMIRIDGGAIPSI